MEKTHKKANYLESIDCIVCHHFVNMIDRLLLTFHGDFLLQQNPEDGSLLLKSLQEPPLFPHAMKAKLQDQAILLLTMMGLAEVKHNGSMLFNRYKTGQHYDIALRVPNDQIQVSDQSSKPIYKQQLEEVPDLISGTKKKHPIKVSRVRSLHHS